MARLRAPVGFWNALALLLAMGVPLALWLAGGAAPPVGARARRRLSLRAGRRDPAHLLALRDPGGHPGRRALARVRAARGSSRRRSCSPAVPAGGLVALWAFGQPGIADDGPSHAARVTDGWQLGVALAARRRPRPGRRRTASSASLPRVTLPSVSRRQALARAPLSSSCSRSPASLGAAMDRRARGRVRQSVHRPAHAGSEPPDERELEQPLGLVAGGLDGLPRGARARDRRRAASRRRTGSSATTR